MEPHSCKVCKRTFPNGRSLGGHMRSHVMLKPPFNQEESSESRYGLREKPKKSKWFDDDDDDGEVEQEEKESWSTGVDDDREEEMQMKNRTRRRKSKLVQAISAASSSPSHSSPEYGALCLMMLSRGACSVSDENEVKRSESDILRIGIKKVDSFASESEFRFEDYEVQFNKGVSFAAVLQPGKKRKSSKRGFDAKIENFSKRSKYECTLCNKSFHSYQALGGHCASHKKNRATSSSVSVAVADHLISKKCRIYECPICGKVFPSGQALGGHKRSHLIAGNSAASSAAISTEVNEIEMNNSKLSSLDLNLPASDFEICDSFDSNRSISVEKFTVFQENCRVSALLM